jgi:hypothetical protein
MRLGRYFFKQRLKHFEEDSNLSKPDLSLLSDQKVKNICIALIDIAVISQN